MGREMPREEQEDRQWSRNKEEVGGLKKQQRCAKGSMKKKKIMSKRLN